MNEALQATKGKDKVKEKMASKQYTGYGGKYYHLTRVKKPRGQTCSGS